MPIPIIPLLFVILASLNGGFAAPTVYSARLVHRFSNEANLHRSARVLDEAGGALRFWPERWSLEYYRRLLTGDIKRQRLKLNPQFRLLYPYEGSASFSLGNDFGWLHYMWIDLGTPKVSYLVALDSGSDLFWVPCDCVHCAPLSSNYYSSLDKNLNEYNPSGSSSSKALSCSHQLCELGTHCPSPELPCPYAVNYYSGDTSTSGFLVEDVLHLVSGHSDASNNTVKAPVVIGCGSKQAGDYLNGVAPDGLLGLGLGEISVPSFLAKAGYIQNSFSLCFKEDDSGRLLFGDQGLADQQTTSYLPLDGRNLTYIVGVNACCIERSCLDQTNFKLLVDSGTSFTFLPNQTYERMVSEFDRQVNAPKATFQGYPWEYCYKSSSQGIPKIPSLTLKFGGSNSLVISNPVFVIYGTEGPAGFCLAIQSTDGEIGTFGQNFMTGYKVVFDRENFRLGWSRSSCEDLSYGDGAPLNSSGNSNPPNTGQQGPHNGHEVAPPAMGQVPSKSSATCFLCFAKFALLIFHSTHLGLINFLFLF